MLKTYKMLSKLLRTNIIIQCFAVAHAVAVILLRYFQIPDEIVLTLLTLGMIVWITRIYNFPIDVAAIISLLSCFAGFFLGIKGAELITLISGGNLIKYSNVITTFFVTEILGWTTYFIVRKKETK